MPLGRRDHWQPSSEGPVPEDSPAGRVGVRLEGEGLGVAEVQKCLPRSPPHSAPALRENLPLSSIAPHSWKSGALFPGWGMGGQGLGKPWGV